MHKLIFLNGKRISPDEPKANLLDASIEHNELGVFETMRTYHRKIFRIHEHLKRLQKSAAGIGISLCRPLSRIQKYIQDAIRECDFDPIRVKIAVTAYDVSIQCEPLIIDGSIYSGVGAVSYVLKRNNPTIKSLAYLNCFKAHQYALNRGCFDAILVNDNGYVTEGAFSNMFWVKDQTLYTVEHGVLEGITRQTVLDLEVCRFGEITLNDLKNADEIFLTQTSREIIPVVQVDDVTIADGNVGSITRTVMEDFKRFVRDTLRKGA